MSAHDVDLRVEIERLAALEQIDYEAVRIKEAKRLAFRAGSLDREVAAKRRALGLEGGEEQVGQGRAVKIDDVLPWPDPVEGDRVATVLSASIKKYFVLPDVAADAIALWILHTWLVNTFEISPRLAITSPTKGCGKTTVLRFLNQVVWRPKRAGSISPPALFRAVEQFQPTVLLDETEKYIEHGSDLHALLNEGRCKGATILRVLGEKMELREFSIFGPVAFARNGRMPDDLEQRSIVIEMQRRRADEAVSELREGRCEQLRNLARMCARWADDVAGIIGDVKPDMGGLINRDADNWHPLFAIAEVIGSDWPDRIREAAAVLAPRETESTGPMLLADIKAAFDDQDKDRLWSENVCEALTEMEGRPWAEFGKARKSISKNQLARLLEPFHVSPDSVRIGDKTKKGYYRHQFEELWRRYPATQGVSETEQRNNADEKGTSCTLKTEQEQPDVPFQNSEKPASNGHCSGVPVELPVAPGVGVAIADHGNKCAQCGGGGDVLETYVGTPTPIWLHRECSAAWQSYDDLSIPAYLDRRSELLPA